jgi:putative ABC transport system permease protein
MNPLAMLRQSLSSIAHNGVRSFLTVLGIVVGIAAVISLVALGQGLQVQVAQRLGDLDATVVTVASADPERPTAQAEQPGAGGRAGRGRFSFEPSDPTLTEDDVAAIAGLAGVEAVTTASEAQLDVAADIEASDATAFIVVGVSEQYPAVVDVVLADGAWLDGTDQVVLGAEAAEELASRPGQTVAVAGRELTVAGILEASDDGNPRASPDGRLFTPSDTWLDLTERDAFDTIRIRATDEDAVVDVVAGVDAALRSIHGIVDGANPDFTAVSNASVLSARGDVISGFSSTLTGIAAISLLVGGIGIMNIMLVTVTERTREIGLRRAVGAKSRHILAQFLTESVVLTGIGGLLGLAVAYLLSGQIASLVTVGSQRLTRGATAVIDADVVLLAVGISVVVGVGFGLFPAMRAARLDPAEALRYE